MVAALGTRQGALVLAKTLRASDVLADHRVASGRRHRPVRIPIPLGRETRTTTKAGRDDHARGGGEVDTRNLTGLDHVRNLGPDPMAGSHDRNVAHAAKASRDLRPQRGGDGGATNRPRETMFGGDASERRHVPTER